MQNSTSSNNIPRLFVWYSNTKLVLLIYVYIRNKENTITVVMSVVSTLTVVLSVSSYNNSGNVGSIYTNSGTVGN
jgi:hypothetical protein